MVVDNVRLATVLEEAESRAGVARGVFFSWAAVSHEARLCHLKRLSCDGSWPLSLVYRKH